MTDEFFCQRCLKDFSTKYKLRRHYNRKKLCKLNGLDITYEDMIKELDIDKSHRCTTCKKSFKYYTSYKNHKCLIKDNLDILSDTIKEQKKILKELIKDKKEGRKIVRNNVNNTLNIMNHNNINITINDFGDEDISHINYQFVLDIISKMNGSAIIKYIKAVHCNNPCNLNIILPNHKQKYVLLWKNNKWELNNKKSVLDGMIVKNFDRINDVYEKIEYKLPPKIKKEYNNYADTFDKSTKERELIKNGALNMLVENNNKLLKN